MTTHLIAINIPLPPTYSQILHNPCRLSFCMNIIGCHNYFSLQTNHFSIFKNKRFFFSIAGKRDKLCLWVSTVTRCLYY